MVVITGILIALPGGGGTPCSDLYGVPPPEGTAFSGFRYTKGYVGVTLVKVYEKVGKSVISVVRRFTGAFYGCENVEKLWFCGLFIF